MCRGVATIDIHLTNIDINQCDDENDDGVNTHDGVKNIGDIFRGTHSCQATTKVSTKMFLFTERQKLVNIM